MIHFRVPIAPFISQSGKNSVSLFPLSIVKLVHFYSERASALSLTRDYRALLWQKWHSKNPVLITFAWLCSSASKSTLSLLAHKCLCDLARPPLWGRHAHLSEGSSQLWLLSWLDPRHLTFLFAMELMEICLWPRAFTCLSCPRSSHERSLFSLVAPSRETRSTSFVLGDSCYPLSHSERSSILDLYAQSNILWP